MKALTVEVETVTMTGKGIWNLTCFVYLVNEINSTIITLS